MFSSSTEVQDAEAEVCLDRRRCWTTPAAFLAIAIFGAAWIATVLLTGCSSVEKPPEATAQVSGPSRRTETGGLRRISLLNSVSPGRRRSTERGDSRSLIRFRRAPTSFIFAPLAVERTPPCR